MKLAYVYPEHLGRDQARVIQVAATVRALVRVGAKVHLVTGRYPGLKNRLTSLGLEPGQGLTVERVCMCQPGPGLPLPFSWHGPFLKSALARLRRLRGQGVEAVLLRHLKPAEFFLDHQDGLGLKIIYEAHELFSQTALEEGMDPEKLARLREREERVLAGADRVLAISRPLARALEAGGLVRGPVAVAPSGVDPEFFADGDNRQADLAAYAGGLGAWKGVDLLLEALALASGVRLEILGGRPGSPDWRRLADLAQRLDLGDRLVMRPRADRAAVRELLARASVAVWPGAAGQRIAAEFTSPLKLFEYLAAGCAVAAPRTPAAESVLTDGVNALLFAPDEPAALARVLERLAHNSIRARWLGRAGRDLARRYTWEARAEVILRAIGETSA